MGDFGKYNYNNSKDTKQGNYEKPSLPSGYLINGYFENGAIKREYILDWADKIAKALTSERGSVAKTQLRKFYDEVVNASDNFERGLLTEAEAIAKVVRLAPIARESVTKGKAPELFAQFFEKNIRAIKNSNDLKAFKEHLESVVCYYPEKVK